MGSSAPSSLSAFTNERPDSAALHRRYCEHGYRTDRFLPFLSELWFCPR